MFNIKLVPLILILIFNKHHVTSIREYSKQDLVHLRDQVKDVFYHAYNGYLNCAFPYDELRPLSCDGIDTWGSYSLTLIDALDTLAIMGNYTEFARVVQLITERANFDTNINVSVFETNIRIVGGLLSAHLFSEKAGLTLEPGWPCNGPLLRLAEDVARRLLPAFDTETGMPYGTVNLRYGVPAGETAVTCTAGVGTFIIEFGTLSRLTGDPIYEEVALNALRSLYKRKSNIGLFGNHIDTKTGVWTAQDSGIGAGVDSYFEYLIKGAILFQRPELLHMFNEIRRPIEKYLKRDDWYLWVSMHKGQVSLPVFQSLEAFWPGILSLIGDVSAGMKSLHNYHQVWKQYGFLPEFYNIVNSEAGVNRESYPLRPELIESVMYLYRATGDPYLLDVGVDMLRSIQHSAKTPCGYATIKNVVDHSQEDRMESFFLSETTKYLYLLFDTENFIHNDGSQGKIFETDAGQLCVLGAGGYVFNTEAHPIDLSALHCCSNEKLGDVTERKEHVKKEVVENEINDDEENGSGEQEMETATPTEDEKLSENGGDITSEANVNATVLEVDDAKVTPSDKDKSNEGMNRINEDLMDRFDHLERVVMAGKVAQLKQDNQKKIDALIKKVIKTNLLSLKQTMASSEDDPIKQLENLENLQWKLDELKTAHAKLRMVNEFLDARMNEIVKKGQIPMDEKGKEKYWMELEERLDELTREERETFAFDHFDDTRLGNHLGVDDVHGEIGNGRSTIKNANQNTHANNRKTNSNANTNQDHFHESARGSKSKDTTTHPKETPSHPTEISPPSQELSDAKIIVNSSMYLVEENQTDLGLEDTEAQPVDECVGLIGEPLALCRLSLTPPPVFNPQKLFERLRHGSHELDGISNASYAILSCAPQPFFTRFTLRGEFFETPP
ncbi:hypothetical protein M8J76_005139 [Diaphorina citri]|nr:hypothetical protein M8J76_005139 [Diaphorina citri]